MQNFVESLESRRLLSGNFTVSVGSVAARVTVRQAGNVIRAAISRSGQPTQLIDSPLPWFMYDGIIVNGSNRADTIDMRGASRPTTVMGNDGDDVILGSPFADLLRAGYGNDFVRGEDGNDIINGGPGADTLLGGNGVDSIFGNGPGRSSGSDGRDELWANDFFSVNDNAMDTLYGSFSNDLLYSDGSATFIPA